MRGVGHKPPRVLECLVQAFDHVVERDGQALQLVTGLRDRQALAEVLRTDAFRAGGNLVHGRKRALDQQGAARDGYERGERKPKDEERKPLPQAGLHVIHRSARLDDIRGAIRGSDQEVGQQHPSACRQRGLPRRFRAARPNGWREFRGSEAPVFRWSREVEYAAVVARNPHETAVEAGRVARLDFIAHARPVLMREFRHQQLSDLPGAAHLVLFQSTDQVVLEHDICGHTDQGETARQQARIPRDQLEPQRAGIHASGWSLTE